MVPPSIVISISEGWNSRHLVQSQRPPLGTCAFSEKSTRYQPTCMFVFPLERPSLRNCQRWWYWHLEQGPQCRSACHHGSCQDPRNWITSCFYITSCPSCPEKIGFQFIFIQKSSVKKHISTFEIITNWSIFFRVQHRRATTNSAIFFSFLSCR